MNKCKRTIRVVPLTSKSFFNRTLVIVKVYIHFPSNKYLNYTKNNRMHVNLIVDQSFYRQSYTSVRNKSYKINNRIDKYMKSSLYYMNIDTYFNKHFQYDLVTLKWNLLYYTCSLLKLTTSQKRTNIFGNKIKMKEI